MKTNGLTPTTKKGFRFFCIIYNLHKDVKLILTLIHYCQLLKKGSGRSPHGRSISAGRFEILAAAGLPAGAASAKFHGKIRPGVCELCFRLTHF